MKKRTVGIYARYNASEQTLCAEFLAGYIVKCYRYAKWFVPDAPEPGGRFFGFSHQWDTEVVSWHGNIERACDEVAVCDTFFFFEPNEEIFAQLPKGAVTAAVLDPGRSNKDARTFAKKCTFTLLPCEYFGSLELPGNAILWPFDPSIQCIMRPNLDYEKEPKLLFPAFGFNFWERAFTLRVADIVKCCKPNVRTAVVYYDANVPPTAGNDSRTFDWRLIRYMQNADWIIDLNPKPVYSLFGACAGGYGLHWIGFDRPPNSDSLNAARRHLVSYGDKHKTNRNILPDLEDVSAQIVAHLDTPFHGHIDRHHCSGAWENRRAEFLRATNIVLGIRTKY